MEWLKYLMIFGSIQGLVLAIALLSIKQPKNKTVNRLFAFLVIFISAFLFINSNGSYFYQYPKLFLLSYIFLFTYTPLFHLFLRALNGAKINLSKRNLLYIIPLLTYSLFLIRYLAMPTETLVSSMLSGNYIDLAAADLVALVINFYFIYQSWTLLQNRGRSWNKQQIRILQVFCIMVLVSNLFWVLQVLSSLGLSLDMALPDINTIWIVTSFLIFFFTYFVVFRSEFFMAHQAPALAAPKQYKMVNRDLIDFKEMESKVLQVMGRQKPYLDPDFSLAGLSQLCHVDKFKLSMAINQGMNTSFFSLVNQYRVEEFIRLTSSDDYHNFSLLGIAQESGFKSKSTFYKAFRELKGQTPKEYLIQSAKPT